MSSQPVTLTYEVDLLPGEILALPSDFTANIEAGRWTVVRQPVADLAETVEAPRLIRFG